MKDFKTIRTIKNILEKKNRKDLSKLLTNSWGYLDESDTFGTYWNSVRSTYEIHSPIESNLKLKELEDEDRNIIYETILDIYPHEANSPEIINIHFKIDQNIEASEEEPEELFESIKNDKTKKLSEEILKCYDANSYRSVIISLWTATICDICYKLEELNNIYSNKKAESILKWINDEKNNPNSDYIDSKWEFELIIKVKREFGNDFISDILLTNLECLKKHRNASAHPVLNESFIPEKPDSDTTRGFIKVIFRELFCKPALRYEGFIGELVVGLEKNKNIFINDTDKLGRFLSEVYFKNADGATKKKVFKALWQFVFKKENSDCDQNREINYLALVEIIKLDPTFYMEEIQNKEIEYRYIFDKSEIISGYFLRLISEFDGLLSKFNDITIQMTKDKVKNDLGYLINYGIKILGETDCTENVIRMYNAIFDNYDLAYIAGNAIHGRNSNNQELIYINNSLSLLVHFLNQTNINADDTIIKDFFNNIIDKYMGSDCFAVSNCRSKVVISIIPYLGQTMLEAFIFKFVDTNNSQITYLDEVKATIEKYFPDLINKCLSERLNTLILNEKWDKDRREIYTSVNLIESTAKNLSIDLVEDKINQINITKDNFQTINSFIPAFEEWSYGKISEKILEILKEKIRLYSID